MNAFNEADLLEAHSEHIQSRLEHYMLAGNFENLDVIMKFVAWVHEEDYKDLHAPRALDGKSFFERREIANLNREIANDIFQSYRGGSGD